MISFFNIHDLTVVRFHLGILENSQVKTWVLCFLCEPFSFDGSQKVKCIYGNVGDLFFRINFSLSYGVYFLDLSKEEGGKYKYT